MSTPPEEPTADEPRARARGVTMASNFDLARMPIPGNAELLVYVLVWLVLTLIWLFSDEVRAGSYATLMVALTFGYLISRGIAKASRVLEQ
jgi:hypothetical protein